MQRILVALTAIFWFETGLVGCATQSDGLRNSVPSTRASKEPTYLSLKKLFNEARLQDVAFLSPGFYEIANREWQQIRQMAQSPGASVVIKEASLHARDALFKAIKGAAATRAALNDVLEARRQAVKVLTRISASSAMDRKATGETFQRGEAKFRDLAEMIEEGRLAEALIQKNFIVRAYLDCQSFLEIKRTLGAARDTLDQARREGAADLVPNSFSSAQLVLRRAEQFAKTHPGAYNELPRRTREAYFYAKQALHQTQKKAEWHASSPGGTLPPLPYISFAE